MRKFYEVAKDFKKSELETQLPRRSTDGSAGYDFFSKINAEVKPGETVKIWTDVKAEMDVDNVLFLDIRSSMGGTWFLNSVIGVVDKDYFCNAKNDGNIGFFLKNISNETQFIKIGDRIGQGIFLNYLKTVDDAVTEKRTGGFGSTGK